MAVYRDIPTFNTSERLWHWGEVPEYFRRQSRDTAAFVGETPTPVLDLGELNPKIQIIQEARGFEFTSCDDIDFECDRIPGGPYGTIFALEILEHLFNPLFFLESIRLALRPDGVVYLSTPGRPRLLWTDQHFHEIDDKRIAWLFGRAGFRVEREGRISLRRPLLQHLRGVRPMLRLFTYTRIYELRIS